MRFRFGVLAAVTTLLILSLFPSVYADVNDFTVTDFTADYYLNTSDPQGAMNIQERITVRFTDNNHGILRALPTKYNGQDEHLKVSRVLRDGHSEGFSTSSSNGNKVLKIGNSGTTITGQHLYEIDYSVQNVIRFTNDHDELDWNTNGLEWSQPFDKITARLHVPQNLANPDLIAVCYTGRYGSTAADCSISKGDTNTVVFTSNRELLAGDTMTFRTDFPVGSFARPTAKDWWHDHGARVLQIAVPPLIVFALAYPYWRKKGKDIRGRGTIVPEYGPPKELHAAEADVINHYKLGKNAISATIIDLAIRKYLRIVETETKGVLGVGKHKVYTLERLTEPASDMLKPYEAKILTGLFPAGETTNISDLKNKFYKISKQVQADIPAALTAAGYFPSNPRKVGAALFSASAAIFIGAWFIFGVDWAIAVGLIAGALVAFIFAGLMPRRTQQGVDAKDRLVGLKLYMEVAEKDRITMLQSPDAPYAAKSDAPKQTVELFEKLLPFAMIMGVEKEWAKQFEGIYTTPPDWYNGNWTAFNTGYLIGSLNGSMAAMNTSFASSPSSGGGGGGFSGGGGGGGGGGGW